MYKKANGLWKSDFKLYGVRYQHTWTDITNEVEALRLEEELKERIKLAKSTLGDISTVGLDWLLGATTDSMFEEQQSMSLSELKEYMTEKVWCRFSDSVNPPNRMDKIIEFFGDVDIRTINTKALEQFKTHLLSLGRAEKTVNHYLSTLNTALTKVEESGRIILTDRPKMSALKMEEHNVKRNIVYSHADEEELLTHLKKEYDSTKSQADLEYYYFIKLMFKLGFRPSEFYKLTIGDLDFNNKTVTISKGNNRGQTKNGVIRTLPIEGETIEIFKKFARLAIVSRFGNPEEGLSEGTPQETKELAKESSDIDTSKLPSILRKLPISGLSKTMCEKRWQKVRIKMGWFGSEEYKDYVQYGIRHTVATRLASELNFGAHQIMRFMGHRNIATSLQYVHLNVEDLREATKIGNSR